MRANVQSRLTVPGESPRASAVSSVVNHNESQLNYPRGTRERAVQLREVYAVDRRGSVSLAIQPAAKPAPPLLNVIFESGSAPR